MPSLYVLQPPFTVRVMNFTIHVKLIASDYFYAIIENVNETLYQLGRKWLQI